MSLRALIWAAVSTKSQAAEDKDSIPRQIADAETVCAANGWQIVDTLVVNGHSRYYKDFAKAASDMRAAGIDALDKLAMYCAMKAFDVFVVRDGSRFARRQSLHAYIVEMIIDSGARIYAAMYGGFVDDKNFGMFIAMDGYRIAGETNTRVNLSQLGKQRQIRNIIPITKSPFGFRKVRDAETGKVTRIEPDPHSSAALFLAGQLLLEGMAYWKIAAQLATMGYTRADGKPYLPRQLWRWLVDPWIWGHTAYGIARAYDAEKHRQSKIIGAWCLDPSYPVPPHLSNEIEIHYNVHPPLFADNAGNLSPFGASVRFEIIRRMLMPATANRANKRGKFTGLLICEDCRFPLVLALGGIVPHWNYRYRGYRCISAQRRKGHTPCTRYMAISEPKVEKWMRALLRAIVATGDMSLFQGHVDNADERQRTQAAIEDVEHQLSNLMKALAEATNDTVMRMYNERVHILGKQLDLLRRRGLELERQQAAAQNASRDFALLQLRELLDEFWNLPAPEINRWLHMLFGKARVVVRRTPKGGVIAGIWTG